MPSTDRGCTGNGSIILPCACVKTPVIYKKALNDTALFVPELQIQVKAKSARDPWMTWGQALRRHFFLMAIIWYGCLSGKPQRITHTLMNYPSCFLCLPHFSSLTLGHASTEQLHTRKHLCQTACFLLGIKKTDTCMYMSISCWLAKRRVYWSL